MRLVVVSNRLPIKLIRDGESWQVRPASGGLITALAPVLRDRGGLWVGWTGTPGQISIADILDPASREVGYALHPVILTQEEVRSFYYGFANEIIWPLFHDLQQHCRFIPEYWRTYLEVNRKFSQVVALSSTESDYIWVHDYHLIHLAQALRRQHVRCPIGFFLHIPFPSPDIYMKLPWRSEILQALLTYDLVGFQTMRDRRNFVQCLTHLVPGVRARGRGALTTVEHEEREVRLGCFPIGIDFEEFATKAASSEVSDRRWQIHKSHDERTIILSVDRLDYTKGIPARLEGFRRALMNYPNLHGRVTFIQVVVPSREEVGEYQNLKAEIEGLVSKINGQFTSPGWIPIHYLYRNLDRTALTAYYRAADIGLITPHKDGMNLVAKEYCACDVEENGTLILSEFAGAAAQMHRWSLLVNPYDYEGIADAIHKAFMMPKAEKRRHMRKLRDVVRNGNVFWWVDSFMEAAFAKSLDDFPQQAVDLTDYYEEKKAFEA
jgi:trehalose 6-phosphate synthase